MAAFFLIFPVLVSLHHHPSVNTLTNKGTARSISKTETAAVQNDCVVCHLLSHQGIGQLPADADTHLLLLDYIESSFLIQTGDTYFFQYHLFPFANSPPPAFS